MAQKNWIVTQNNWLVVQRNLLAVPVKSVQIKSGVSDQLLFCSTSRFFYATIMQLVNSFVLLLSSFAPLVSSFGPLVSYLGPLSFSANICHFSESKLCIVDLLRNQPLLAVWVIGLVDNATSRVQCLHNFYVAFASGFYIYKQSILQNFYNFVCHPLKYRQICAMPWTSALVLHQLL